MKTNIIILGGGITGRIAHHHLRTSVILEARGPESVNALTHQYGTNYLWERIEGFTLRSCTINTTVDGKKPTEESIVRYKNKIGKGEESKSEWGLQFKSKSQGYTIEKYPRAFVMYDHKVRHINLKTSEIFFESGRPPVYFRQLISTIPLNTLCELCGLGFEYPIKTIFKCSPVYVKLERIFENLLDDKIINVNYVSSPTIPHYRYCDRNGIRHYESLHPEYPVRLFPGKIWYSPMVDVILEHLEKHNVKCFGRYGKWNPNELLHETNEEVKQWNH